MPREIDEHTLRRLMAEGLSQREISRRLGVPRTTLQDYLKRQGLVPVRPPAPPAPQVPAPPATPAMTFVAVPELQEMLELLRHLNTRVEHLEQARVPPALPAAPSPPTTPAPPAAERKDIQQWTVRLSKTLIEYIKAVAYERRVHPSQLLEELVWQALKNPPSSTP